MPARLNIEAACLTEWASPLAQIEPPIVGQPASNNILVILYILTSLLYVSAWHFTRISGTAHVQEIHFTAKLVTGVDCNRALEVAVLPTCVRLNPRTLSHFAT